MIDWHMVIRRYFVQVINFSSNLIVIFRPLNDFALPFQVGFAIFFFRKICIQKWKSIQFVIYKSSQMNVKSNYLRRIRVLAACHWLSSEISKPTKWLYQQTKYIVFDNSFVHGLMKSMITHTLSIPFKSSAMFEIHKKWFDKNRMKETQSCVRWPKFSSILNFSHIFYICFSISVPRRAHHTFPFRKLYFFSYYNLKQQQTGKIRKKQIESLCDRVEFYFIWIFFSALAIAHCSLTA